MTQPDPITFSHPDGSSSTFTFAVGAPVGSSSGGTIPLTVGYTYTPAPVMLPEMILGDAYGLDLADFPHDAYGILFNAPGRGVNTTAIAAFPKDVLLLVCVKDVITTSMLASMVAARGNYPLWISWHQEPEGDLPSADYIAGQKALRVLIDALPVGQRVMVSQVGKVTLYAEQHGKGPITAWFAGTAKAPVEDIMGVDCYFIDKTAKAYPDPETFYADPIAWAKAAGVPLAITEWGMIQLPWDTDGSALADAITAHISYLRGIGALVAAWWHGKGTNFNYLLTGKPLAALQEAMAA